jgi:hypothetical protein
MSDEIHMESAFLRADPTRRSQWHELPPDELLMVAEDGPGVPERRAEILEAIMSFLFADGASDWRKVAVRAMAVLGQFAPAVAVGMRTAVEPFTGWGLRSLVEIVDKDSDEARKALGWLFQERGPSGLLDGCQRVYLVAKAFQPQLIKIEVAQRRGAGVDLVEMGFEDMARAFGELAGRSDGEAGARARSRWSARAAKMVRCAMERPDGKGGKVDLFGKMSATREKYAKAALGNNNRSSKH